MNFAIVSVERAAEHLGVSAENLFKIAARVGALPFCRIDGADYFTEAAVDAIRDYLQREKR